ncbi:MAG: hypothetical protein ACJAZO_002912 [Myxococcota bacterium]
MCDGQDNNCNGDSDENLPSVRVWADSDNDGSGDPSAPTFACGERPSVADAPDDCDDTDPNVGPNSDEIPDNSLDDDCDGYTDETRVPEDFMDVPAALAGVADGTVIQLGRGTFFTTVDLTGRDITLAGAGCGQTIVYADGAGSVLTMTAGTVASMTLAGGVSDYGGGLHINGDVIAHDLCVEGNTVTERGGGIALRGGSLLLTDSTVSRNVAESRGGGLFVVNNAELTMERVQFLDNRSGDDGGNIALASAIVRADGIVIAGGSATNDGGGIYMLATRTSMGDVLFRNTTLHGNEARRGPAIAAIDASIEFVDSLITGHDDGEDEAIYLDDGDVRFDTVAWDNTGLDTTEGYQTEGIRDLPIYVQAQGAASTWDLRLSPDSALSTLATDGGELGAWGGANSLEDAVGSANLDTDSDSMPDGWELSRGLLRFDVDNSADPDGDGLSNGAEWTAGAEPDQADSDSDGVLDDLDDRPRDPSNHRPFADAGTDRLIRLGDDITASSAASFDPNGDSLQRVWTLTPPAGGSDVPLTVIGDDVRFTPDASGTWRLVLTVSDAATDSTHEVAFTVFNAVTVPDDAPDITSALAQSATVIALQPGRHVGADLGTANITLFGLGTSDSVIVEGPATGSALTATANLRLAHLTVENGHSDLNGGCIDLTGTLTLQDVTLQDCSATRLGGGAYVDGDVTAVDTRVQSNSAREGGGLYVTGEVTWLRGAFVDNTAILLGGAVYDDTDGRQDHRFANVLFQDNSARDAAVLFAVGGTSRTLIEHSVLFGNETAVVASGSVVAQTGPITVRDSVFVGNRGGAVIHEGPFGHIDLVYGHAQDNAGIASSTTFRNADAYGLGQGAVRVAQYTDNALARDDVWFAELGSPLVDSAVPGSLDLDGSAADTGLGGGPDAPRSSRLYAVDTDGDGLSDGWEFLVAGGDVLPSDDADSDGLTNAEEHTLGTSAILADTDNDGVSDADEVSLGQDPLNTSDNRPIANAGDVQTIERGTTEALDGTASSDPNNDSLTFVWTVTLAPETSTLLGTTLDAVATPDFAPDARGSYDITLVVSDGSALSRPDTVRVMGSGDILVPQDLPTVAAALDIARSGDTIRLGPGEFAVSIREPHSAITLAGEGPELTTLVPSTPGTILQLENTTFTLRGLTVRGGVGITGGSVDCRDSDFTAENVIFEEGISGQGGALRLQGCNTVLTDVHVRNSWSTGSGGGIYVTRGSLVWVRGSLIGNRAGANGGGLYASLGSTVVQNVVMANNRTPSPGGALYSASGSLNAAFLTVVGNSSNRGAIFVTSTTGQITHSILADNTLVGVQVAAGDGFTATRNGYWNNENGPTTPSALQDADDVLADPQFVSTDDWHLRADSPMVDAGSLDFLDRDGSVADLGAYGSSRASHDYNEWYVDSDNDGLPDGWEREYGLSVGLDDSTGDTDNDGSDALSEWLNSTDPRNPDTDADGQLDGVDTQPTQAAGQPSADAGDDQVVDTGDSVTLIGSGSIGTITARQWRIIERPGRSVASLATPSASMTSFTADIAGRYIIGLVVTNGEVDSAEDRAVVDVRGTLLVPDDYAEVQEALDIAASGSTIEIAAGTWTVAAVSRGRDLTVIGAGRDQTHLLGNDAPIFEVEGPNDLTVIDMTLSGGFSAAGGAIRVAGFPAVPASLTLESVSVEDSLALDGGGVSVADGTFTLTRCRFVGNQAVRHGGAVRSVRSTGTVLQTLVVDNHAAEFDGGGMYINDGFVSVSNSIIADNTARSGGGITVQAAPLQSGELLALSRVTATGNSAVLGGAFLSVLLGDASASNSIFASHHTSPLSVGGSSDIALLNTVFSGQAPWVAGGTDPIGTDGNIEADPLFTANSNDADWTNDDWTLQLGSAADGLGAYSGPDGGWSAE